MLAENNQKDQPKVSIILPVYNVERYLRQCMESVINQTLNSIEVIAVNDGSTDSSLEILKEYAYRDSRVHVICQPNKGTLIARLEGFQNSTGQYILFVDPDDWIEPDTCEQLFARIRETGDDILLFGIQSENEGVHTKEFKSVNSYFSGLVEKLNSQEEILKACYVDRRFPWSLSGRLFSRSVLESAFAVMPKIRCNYAEDVLSTFYILSYCRTLSSVHSYFYHYRVGVGLSTKKTISKQDFVSVLQSYNIFFCVKEFAKERYKGDLFIHSIIEQIKSVIDGGVLTMASRLKDHVKQEDIFQDKRVHYLKVIRIQFIISLLLLLVNIILIMRYLF